MMRALADADASTLIAWVVVAVVAGLFGLWFLKVGVPLAHAVGWALILVCALAAVFAVMIAIALLMQ